MLKQVTILVDIPADTDYPEAYQTLFNAADDIGEVRDLSIRNPPKDYESLQDTNRGRVLQALKVKTTNGQPKFLTLDEIRARLGPEKRTLMNHLEALTNEGRIIMRKDRVRKWKLN